jgi:glutathione synthase/RimK-type ligase-like ATP-grasp enzyme
MLEAKANGAGAFLEWINIKKEYRIHVFRGLLISICEKKKTRKAHKNIRSASHGWEFCEDAKLHTVDAVSLISAALAAVQALKLDFGAVDIAMNKNNIPVVFEVNTAPGLNEKRAKLYAKAINKWLDTTY